MRSAQTSNKDAELIASLVSSWHETRRWAEALLTEALGLAEPMDVLEQPRRGRHQIEGTDWWYRTHGSGVDVFQPGNMGGIDFDFAKYEIDRYRLRFFMIKQFNAGNLEKSDYRPLLQDEARWDAAFDSWSRLQHDGPLARCGRAVLRLFGRIQDH